MREAVDAYVASLKAQGLKSATYERAEDHLAHLLQLERTGKRPIAWLTKRGQELYDAARIRDVDPEDGTITPYAVATHRGALSAGRAFGKLLIKRGWLRVNPFAEVEGVGRRNHGRAKPQLRVDEARTLTDFLIARCTPVVKSEPVAVLAALLLGPRATEVVERDVRDLDDNGTLLWIPDSKTESGRRQLEVPEVLRPLLRELAKDRIGAAPLFTDRHGERPTRWWIAYHCRALCRLAKVPAISPHGLRRSHSSIARRGGATGELVAAQLGHGSTSVQDQSYVQPGAAQAAETRAVELRVVKGGRS